MRKKTFVTAVALGLALLLCSCAAVPATVISEPSENLPVTSAEPSQQTQTSPDETPDLSVISIGALLPKTGVWESQGTAAQMALEKGLPYVNTYLKAYGLEIKLDLRDTQSDPAVALSELESMHEAGVNTVIGPMSSEESINVLQYAMDNAMLLLSPSATASELSKEDSFFRMVATDASQIDGLTRIMSSVYKIENLICVHLDDTYGRGFNDLLGQMSGSQGMEVIGSVALPSDGTDYTAAAAQLSELAADADSDTTAVVLVSSSQMASGLIREAAKDTKLGDMKWFAGADIIGDKTLFQDEQVSAFLEKTGMEGLTIGYKDIALDALPYIGAVLDGAADYSAYAIPTWDALWLLADTFVTDPDADFEMLKQNLVSCAGSYRNAFGSFSTLDANGDALGSKYMRYICVDDNGRSIWRCKGHYVNLGAGEPIIQTIEWKTAPDAGEVNVGVLLPLSGSHSENGKEVDSILKYAAEFFNLYAKESGSDLNLNLLIEDTQSDPAEAAKAAEKLIGLGVSAIIGPIDSSELETVKPLIDEAGIIDISPLSSSPSLGVKDSIYRLVLNDSVQTKALSALMKQDGIEKVVVLNANDTYGNEIAALMDEIFEGDVVLIPYETTLTTYTDVLAQADLAVKGGDLSKTAVLTVSHEELGQIMNELSAESSLKDVRWYGTDSTAFSGELLANAAETAAAVRYTALDYSPYGKYFDPLYFVLNDEIKSDNPLKESAISAFDGLWLLGCAYLNEGTTADFETINTYVSTKSFRGLGGVVKLDENGDRQFGYYNIYQVTADQDAYTWQSIGVYSQDFVKQGILEMYP